MIKIDKDGEADKKFYKNNKIIKIYKVSEVSNFSRINNS